PYCLSFHLASPSTISSSFLSFRFTTPPPTDTSTLSLHDALPIFLAAVDHRAEAVVVRDDHRRAARHRLEQRDPERRDRRRAEIQDRKSTRLNSSHRTISYAVFCLKKKTNTTNRY